MAYSNPQYPAAPQVGPPYGAPYGALAPVDPGRGLGIAGLVCSILGLFTFGGLSIIGLILSIIARKRSREAGFTNGLANAGLWIAIASLILGVILGAVVGCSLWQVMSQCNDLGPGEHVVNGVTITCG